MKFIDVDKSSIKAVIIKDHKRDFPLSGNAKEVIDSSSLIKGQDDLDLTSENEKELFLDKLIDLSKGTDYLCVFYFDSPFYCIEDCETLIDSTIGYDNDYGFGDNYPNGTLCEVVRSEVLPVFRNLYNEKKVADDLEKGDIRGVLHKIISIDYNTFDLENQFSQPSLRTYRLSFFQQNYQNIQIVKRLADEMEKKSRDKKKIDFSELAAIVEGERHLWQTDPAYVSLEISQDSFIESKFSPRKKFLETYDVEMMPLEKAKIYISKLKALGSISHVNLNGIGEPLIHPNVSDIINEIEKELSATVVVETSLVGVSTETLNEILKSHPSLMLIVTLDASSIEKYKGLKTFIKDIPSGCVSEDSLFRYIDELLIADSARKKSERRIYVQLIKTIETFSDIQAFSRKYKEVTNNIIIQKYNTYGGLLPEQREDPAKPLHHIDCWHLKRDIFISAMGDVYSCQQDVFHKNSFGNLNHVDMTSVLEKRQEFFKEYLSDSGVPAVFCKDCDENYTYNF